MKSVLTGLNTTAFQTLRSHHHETSTKYKCFIVLGQEVGETAMVTVCSALADDLTSVASIHITQLQPPLPALENSFIEHMYSRTISPMCLTQKSNYNKSFKIFLSSWKGGSLKYVPLLQRTWIQFPVPMSFSSQLSVTPALGHLMPLISRGLSTHTCMVIHRHTPLR